MPEEWRERGPPKSVATSGPPWLWFRRRRLRIRRWLRVLRQAWLEELDAMTVGHLSGCYPFLLRLLLLVQPLPGSRVRRRAMPNNQSIGRQDSWRRRGERGQSPQYEILRPARLVYSR